jgi:single-strand DNA-binding protein
VAGKSLNKVQLIGNLTRDPELRYTPQGTPVCSFGIATSRSWAPGEGKERQEEVEYHNIVAWSKLAEICGEYLTKGKKVYIEGRLKTSSWETPEGEKKYKTEIIAEDMMMLDGRGRSDESEGERPSAPAKAAPAPKKDDQPAEDISPDEIPF